MKAMIRKSLKTLSKIAVAGAIALVILTLFYLLYHNIPMYSANEPGSPLRKWEPNVFYSRGSEGFAWGRGNNDGYNNLFDYDDGMKIDILVMGSSHMNAYNVATSQSTASRLNALLENETVYNIGVSGDDFAICAGYFRAALKKYQPEKYVIIETDLVSFSDEAISLAISEKDTAKAPGHTDAITTFFKKSPYIREMYQNAKDYITNLRSKSIEDAQDIDVLAELNSEDNNESLLNSLLGKMSALAEEYGVKPIIMYHPYMVIASDGMIDIDADQNEINRFKRLCDTNGILFLDMSDRFKAEYERMYVLPHGFSNTRVGSGHLNQHGHAMIADELYGLISEDMQ